MALINPDTSGIVNGATPQDTAWLNPFNTITNEINGRLDTNNLAAAGVDIAGIASSVAWSTWAPTFTGFSADPTGGVFKYMKIGTMVWIIVNMPNNGTSNDVTFRLSLPVTAIGTTNQDVMVALPFCVDNSSESSTKDRATIFASSPTEVRLSKNQSINGWTNSGGKRAQFEMIYEAAA